MNQDKPTPAPIVDGDPETGLAAQLAAGRAALIAARQPSKARKPRRRRLSDPAAAQHDVEPPGPSEEPDPGAPAPPPDRDLPTMALCPEDGGPGPQDLHPPERDAQDPVAVPVPPENPPATQEATPAPGLESATTDLCDPPDPVPAVPSTAVSQVPDPAPQRWDDDENSAGDAAIATAHDQEERELTTGADQATAPLDATDAELVADSPSTDVVALVAELADRARAAEAEVTAARAQLAGVEAALAGAAGEHQDPAVDPPASAESEPGVAQRPDQNRGPRSSRRRRAVLAAVAAVSAIGACAWWTLYQATPTPTANPSPPAATSTPSASPSRVADDDLAAAAEQAAAEERAAAEAAAAEQAAADAAAADADAAQEPPPQQAPAERQQDPQTSREAPAQQQAGQAEAQPAPVAQPVRAATRQTVTCSPAGTVTFTATGGGLVEISAGGQHAAGHGAAVLSVSAGPTGVSAAATGDDWVRMNFDWVAASGTCS
jgi:hypothetical protein